MNVSIIPTAQQAQGIDFGGCIAIVIDVLRATSVITIALNNGAREVIPVKTVEEAKGLYATLDADSTLLGGERNAVKIEGFDLSNSPLEYTQEAVGGKILILTTTNGTNAINNVKSADEVVLACFRNAAAVAEYIVELSHCGSRDVIIACAGTEGRFSLDDGLCAGMLIELLKQYVEVETDDLGLLLSRYYEPNKGDLAGALKDCFHLQRLRSLGFDEDIRFCFEMNSVTTIPVMRGNTVVLP